MRRSRIAGPSRVARDEHRPAAGAPAADPGGLAGALTPGSPPVGDYFGRPGSEPADRGLPHCRHPPASLLQPGAHDHQRDGRTGRNRPVGHDRRIFLVGGCYLVAARRASPRPLILIVYGSAAVTAVFVALLGWLLAETRDGSVLGLAERLTSSIQTCWPFIVAVALRRTRRPRPG